MAFNVQISPSDLNFAVDEESFILDAALAAKINLPYGCKNGICGACKCKLMRGNVAYDKSLGLSNQELVGNEVLLCRARAMSDIILDLPNFTNNTQAIKILPAKIVAIEKLKNVARVKLKLPGNQKFDFQVGQYIDVMHHKISRSYSIANADTGLSMLELHIRYHKGGIFSEIIWNELKVGDIVRIKGPLGQFTLKANDDPMLMVCTGTGLAPAKAIIEHMIGTKDQRKVHLIWGNNALDDFYLADEVRQWQDKMNLKLTFCVKQQAVNNHHYGSVTDYVSSNFNDLSQYHVYACGNPAMIKDLSILAKTMNLNPNNFYSDSFVNASKNCGNL